MRPHCFRLCSAALVFSVLPSLAAAQKTVPDPYSGEPLVLERADDVYAMNADGTGYMQKTVVVKIQSEAARQQLGIIGQQFAANSQHVEFHYVRVRRPDGSVTETPTSSVLEQPMQVTVQAPFYSDLKVAQVPVKNLQVGDTLEWEGRVVTTKPEAPNEFWDAETFVTEGSVVREQSVELRVPATKAVTVWTNPASGIKMQQVAGGRSEDLPMAELCAETDGGAGGRCGEGSEEEACADRRRRDGRGTGQAAIHSVDDLSELGGSGRMVSEPGSKPNDARR